MTMQAATIALHLFCIGSQSAFGIGSHLAQPDATGMVQMNLAVHTVSRNEANDTMKLEVDKVSRKTAQAPTTLVNVVMSGSQITKNAGGSGYNAYALYDGVRSISVRTETSGHKRIGLTSNSGDNQDFPNGKYVGLFTNGVLYCPGHSNNVYSNSDIVKISYQDNTFTVYKNGAEVCSWQLARNGALFAKVFINEQGESVQVVQVVKTTTTTPAPRQAIQASTPAPTPGLQGSAVGDPHMENIVHERFDVLKRGVHTLLQIPRFAAPEQTLLRAECLVRNFKNCAAQFIRRVNLTGQWAEAANKGGRVYDADMPTASMRNKVKLGPVTVQVDYVRSKKGFVHLNFVATRLGKVQSPIGGILGLDDHTYAARMDCPHRALQLSRSHEDVFADMAAEGQALGDDVEGATGSFALGALA